jgi:cardiolipin synthase
VAALMTAGVEFHQYQPTLFHCKIVIIDDMWSIVGSINLDARSLRTNDEANLNVLDHGFAAQLIKAYDDDLRQSEPLTSDDLKKRNIFTKVSDHMFGLMRAEL